MKKPDEIKKGLPLCGDICKNGNGCPYAIHGLDCTEELMEDALAYILQLERERDAAVDYLAMTKDCKTCKHFPHAASEEPCRSCGVRQANWEWRGVKEEYKNEAD